MRTVTSIALLIATAAASAAAQAPKTSETTVDPGMTKAQVVEKLGRPVSEHSSGGWTYLYYKNGQEQKFGMNDLVTLENDKVVDAIFRSPARHFSGHSSSPSPVPVATAIARGRSGSSADSTKKSPPPATKKP